MVQHLWCQSATPKLTYENEALSNLTHHQTYVNCNFPVKLQVVMLKVSENMRKLFQRVSIIPLMVCHLWGPSATAKFTYENHAFSTLTNCPSHQNRIFPLNFF